MRWLKVELGECSSSKANKEKRSQGSIALCFLKGAGITRMYVTESGI